MQQTVFLHVHVKYFYATYVYYYTVVLIYVLLILFLFVVTRTILRSFRKGTIIMFTPWYTLILRVYYVWSIIYRWVYVYILHVCTILIVYAYMYSLLLITLYFVVYASMNIFLRKDITLCYLTYVMYYNTHLRNLRY